MDTNEIIPLIECLYKAIQSEDIEKIFYWIDMIHELKKEG